MTRSPVRPALKRVKRMMPANLFGRTLLILLLPIVLLQLLMADVFYERHWDSVVRNMSSTTAADAEVLLQEYHHARVEATPEEALQHSAQIGEMMRIHVRFAPPNVKVTDQLGAEEFPDFYRSLDARIPEPFMVKSARDGRSIRVSIDAGERVLELTLPAKRLASSTTNIFILWMVGSSLLLVLIAALFLRNQIRPIVQLARAAEQFGLGQNMRHFSPRGASEIRRAGRAFLIMAERIRRQVASRTEMLAGISHDLRTPLTRMQLEIEMGNIDAPTRSALVGDIEDMRKMIDEYLDFARGDAGERMEAVAIDVLVQQLVEQYARAGADVALEIPPPFGGSAVVPSPSGGGLGGGLQQTPHSGIAPHPTPSRGQALTSPQKGEELTLMLRPQAIRRALTNLIDNALRYGKRARVSVEPNMGFVRIKITDSGTGIPEIAQETVFKPFTRLEPSRNSTTGGVGLGLSIARDIAQSHGGDIALENQRDAAGNVTGLEATLRLPREVQVMT